MQGVYAIIHKETKRAYIGSSVDISRRFRQHQKDLRLKQHGNWMLQRDYNLGSVDSFDFKILQIVSNYCGRQTLYSLEQEWIDKTANKYNILLDATAHIDKEKEVNKKSRILEDKVKKVKKARKDKKKKAFQESIKTNSSVHKSIDEKTLWSKKTTAPRKLTGRKHTALVKQQRKENTERYLLMKNSFKPKEDVFKTMSPAVLIKKRNG